MHTILFRLILLVILVSPLIAEAQTTPYRIMLTNDDGYESPGIMALYDALSAIPNTEVTIVAPNRNYSGAGHWVMLRDPFFVTEIKREGNVIGYHVNVPPASCVTIGLKGLLNTKPDLVVSGVNRGANAGLVTLSSGTVAGAREGAMNGIPSIAFSMDRPRTRGVALDFTRAVQYARKVVEMAQKNKIPNEVFLNVNLPSQDKEIKGIRHTRQSKRDLDFSYIQQKSPFGSTFYWQTRSRNLQEAPEDSDEWALINGYVSITPFTIDQTTSVTIPGLKELTENN